MKVAKPSQTLRPQGTLIIDYSTSLIMKEPDEAEVQQDQEGTKRGTMKVAKPSQTSRPQGTLIIDYPMSLITCFHDFYHIRAYKD